MAWVEQIGYQSWRVRYPGADAKTESVSGFASRLQAESYVAELRPLRQHAVWVDPAAGRTTVEEWTRRWLPTLTVTERTEENYRRDLRNHILLRWARHRWRRSVPVM
jgi:hypothetical protein